MADDELRRLERLALTDPLAAERLVAARARAGRTPPVDAVAAASAALDEVEGLARALRGQISGTALAEVARGRLRIPGADAGRSRSMAVEALDLLRAETGQWEQLALSSRCVAAAVLARVGDDARGLREVDAALARLRDRDVRWGHALVALGRWPGADRVATRAARVLQAGARFLPSALREDEVVGALGRLGLVDAAASALRSTAHAGFWIDAVEGLRRLERATPPDAGRALEDLVESEHPAELFQAQSLAALLELAPPGPRDRCLAWAGGRTECAALPVRLAQLRLDLARRTAGVDQAIAFVTEVLGREGRRDMDRIGVDMRVVTGALGAAAASAHVDEAALAELARRALDARRWDAFTEGEVLQAAAAAATRLPTVGPELLLEVARRMERLVSDRTGRRPWWLGYEALGALAQAAGPLVGSEAGRRLFEDVVAPALEGAVALTRVLGRQTETGRLFAAQALVRSALAAQRRGDEELSRRWREAAEATLSTHLSIAYHHDLARDLARAAEESGPATRAAAVIGAARGIRAQVGQLHGAGYTDVLAATVADLVDAAVSLVEEPT